MSIGLEAFLEARGRPLGELTGATSPFVPVAWELTIERSIAFEDDVEIVGEVLAVEEGAVEIAYEFWRPATDDVCIRADLTYGCLDDDGDRVAFPAAALEAVTD